MLQILIAVLAVAVVALTVYTRRLQAQLNNSRKDERMKVAFLQNISHEIKTPLQAISEKAEVVAKPDLYLSKNEKRDIADQLKYNANLISTLFDEALMFSDEREGGHPLKDEMFSPNALCRRCLEANMHSIYHRQAVKLTFRRELSDEFFVKSDRHLVELILNKLIQNACRFTEKGEVTVGCNVSEYTGRLTIFVSDTGVGVPESRVNSLFTWFDAPDDMMDEAELDLSICRKLAEKLGGQMMHDNQQSSGTRMVVVLPLK